MATAADEPYEAVTDDLARTIRKLRSDCVPGETARQLMEYDTPGHTHLVGIDFEGMKAVYHSCTTDEVIFVCFGPDGLDDGGPVMGSFGERGGIEVWIKKMGAYWGWVHPSYQ